MLLSGGFGGGVSPASAAAIGLFPPGLVGRSSWIGNASGLGAVRLLLRDDERETAQALAARSRVIDTASAPGFDELFARHLFFPAPDAVLDAVEPLLPPAD